MGDKGLFKNTRNELTELKEELAEQNRDKQREAVKRVIGAMTLGVNVSSLFPDMLNCMHSPYLDVKKLVYLYVTTYAKAHPDMAVLAVNSFRKDTMDANPLVRALAIRTMGYIRLEGLHEYLTDSLRKCCRDEDPYVRKTAAICIAKLHAMSPAQVEEGGFRDILVKELLVDANPMVVANSAAALLEIQKSGSKGKIRLTPEIASNLLSALNECSEWAQATILDTLTLYDCPDSTAARVLIDRVTPRFSHANSAVVLSAIRLVLKAMESADSAEVVRATCKKMAGPLITLLAEPEPPLQYLALRNIAIVAARWPAALAGEIKPFLVKYTDLPFVKTQKLELLVSVVSERTADQVLLELRDYAAEVDADFARAAVRALGRVALRLDKVADKCASTLLEILEASGGPGSMVGAEVFIALRDMLRSYPGRYEAVITPLMQSVSNFQVFADQPQARDAYAWILGEFADRLQDAQQRLSDLVNSYFTEQVLVSTVKLGLKSPTQASQALVSTALQMATTSTEDYALRDRGFFLWRLLTVSPQVAREAMTAVTGRRPRVVADNVSGLLAGEVGTLASLLNKPVAAVVADHKSTADNSEDSNGDIRDFRRGESPRKTVKKIVKPPVESSESSSSEDEAWEMAKGVKKFLVLKPESAGAPRGVKGLKVAAGFGSGEDGKLYFALTVGNFSSPAVEFAAPFALQFNKNTWGLAPEQSLLRKAPGSIPGGAFFETAVEVVKREANKAPSGETIQVALKTSLDVFYFAVPIDTNSL